MHFLRMSKPNYSRAEKAAYALLYKFGKKELPIFMFDICRAFPNLKVRTYTWFANKRKISFDEAKELAESESGCYWDAAEYNQYMILYNDTIDNVGHIRWTIAHELGHYILKHKGYSLTKGNSLSTAEYDVLEKEANCFARSLLAPPNVLAALNVKTIVDIMDVCNISYLAASNVFQFLNNGLLMRVKYLSTSSIMKSFNGFILEFKNSKYCPICSFSFISETANYCPICGCNGLLKEGGQRMIYDSYDLDENGRARICPKCENEETTFCTYCIICGTDLINKCAGTPTYDNGYEEYSQSCDNLAPGNARYCFNCGNETTFFQSGVLKPWDEKIRKLEVAAALDEVPF